MSGLIAEAACLTLTMAERCAPDLAARLAQVLDAGRGHCLIALDEGAAPDEGVPPALIDRVAFQVDLNAVSWQEAEGTPMPEGDLQHRLATARDDDLAALTAVAARAGIDSLRAPLFALRAARAHAALAGRDAVAAEDLEMAAALVLAPRATRLPEDAPEPEADQDPPPPDQGEDQSQDGQGQDRLPEEILVEALRAILPDGLIDALAAPKTGRGGRGSGAGSKRKGNRRGRPLPSRPGRPGGTKRVDLVATLRSAAPWQPLRQRGTTMQRLVIHPSDLRVRRFEDRSDRLLVFTVDASGSAALARLAEAKGAVELLLARAYATRDHVALIAFRGTEAEALLPPTRSLVQTKRRLAELPGGGGTPLAAGLRAAGELAEAARHHGLSPTIVLLTDGRANIALDGRANRAAAQEDAQQMARWLLASGHAGLVLDVGNRPSADLRALAASMCAPYLPLPRADAGRLSTAVGNALEG
jgi:magnesium chelatase subunit D